MQSLADVKDSTASSLPPESEPISKWPRAEEQEYHLRKALNPNERAITQLMPHAQKECPKPS